MGKDKNNHAVHADALRVQKKISHWGNRVSVQLKAPDVKKAPAPPQVPSIIAGIVHGMVVLMSFTSFAFLIFGNSDHAELQAIFPLAISQQVLSASVLIGLLTFRGHFPFTMGGPTPPAALLVADVVRAAVDAVDEPDKKVPTAFLVIGLVSIIMGLVLLLLGLTGTASYAQQLPYPVMCGFLGSVGILLVRNAIQILFSVKLRWVFLPVNFEDVAQIDMPIALAQVCLGITVCVLLLFVVPRVSAFVQRHGFKATAVLPLAFVLPLLSFFAIAGLSGMDFGAEGKLRTTQPSWLFSKVETKEFWTFWGEAYAVDRWDLDAVASALPNVFIASILCVLAALINMAGIEANAPQPKVLNLNKEFTTLGQACLVTGALAGHPGHHVAAFTLPMKKDGGSTRTAPWIASLLWLIVFLTSAPISSFVPRFFMGGCFLQIGVSLARTFLWDNRKSMDMVSKSIALLMVLVSLFTDLNYAAGFGFVLVCLNFIRLSEGVDVVRSVSRLDMQRSPKQRSMEEIALLTKHGHKVMMLHLHGYLFWGTVDKIFDAFDEVIDGTPDDPEVIYVDLEEVSGVEVSVVSAFRKLHRIAKNAGINIVLCGFPDVAVLGPQVDTLLRSLPFANPKPLVDLLEENEDKLLTAFCHEMQKVCIECPLTSLQLELRERRTLAKQRILARYAQATGSVYAIRWESVHGFLHLGQTHNSNERACYLVKAALTSQKCVQSFVTHSGSMGPRCDAPDVLCQSWRRQQALLCHDVSLLPPESFARLSFSQEFAIQRVVFVPTVDGVYEFGSVKLDQFDASSPNLCDLDMPSLLECDVERFARAVAPLHNAPVLEADLQSSSKTSEEATVGYPILPDELSPTSLRVKSMDKDGCLDGLRNYFSWSLLLSMFTLCNQQQVKTSEPLVPDESCQQVADCMFIVVDGIFGTFNNHADVSWDEDAVHPRNLVLKAGVGALLGASDMFLQRPWSVKIVCLSETGRVIRLQSEVVRQLEMCESPFANLETSHEFVQYLKSQMALQELTMSSSVTSV